MNLNWDSDAFAKMLYDKVISIEGILTRLFLFYTYRYCIKFMCPFNVSSFQ